MQNHIIRKQILHIKLSRQSHAWSDEQEFVRIFREEGMPAMEKIFDEVIPVGKTLRLDKLEIDLGSISLASSADQWRAMITKTIYNALKERIAAESGEQAEDIFETPEMSAEKSWLFFLEHGMLPWWMQKPELGEWEFAVLTFISAQNPSRLSAFLVFLKRHNQALERLLAQNSAAFQWELLQILFAQHAAISGHFKKAISKLIGSRTDLQIFLRHAWIALLEGSAEHFLSKIKDIGDALLCSENPAIILEHLRKNEQPLIRTNHVLVNIRHQEPGLSDRLLLEKDKPVCLPNTGLVILAPFISAFFENLRYTEKHIFIDASAQNQAVLALHYMASGNTGAMEYELAFEKLLCDVPPTQPLNAGAVLNENEMQQADELLRVVIGHWSGLGTCGPDNFRRMFLSRPGKLALTSTDWVLNVENNSFDVLFRSLPWGISMIRLPWMKHILNVEWNY